MTLTHRHPRGFTLIELLFSMVIGSVLLVVAATMLGSSGDGYERIGGNVASEREARAAITQLAADLSTARFHKDGLIQKSTAAWAVDKLGFLSLQPAQAQSEAGRIGDLCAVNYYVSDQTIGGKEVRCLMRGFRESNETFKALREDKVAALFEQKSDDDGDELIAFGVISFEARPRSRDSAGQWIDWIENDDTGPEAFDLKLVLARRDLSGKLKLSSDWEGAGSAAKLLGEPSKADRNKDLEVYGTTLRFGNHATL